MKILIPCEAEKSITGYVIGFEKKIKNQLIEVKYFLGENRPKIYKNGNQVTEFPEYIYKFTMQTVDHLKGMGLTK